jgi:predicted AAA+ superfamily ATPase
MLQIERALLPELIRSASSYPVVSLLGPRQSGKTTLVKKAFPNKPYLSLEDHDVRSFATEDPRQFLAQYPDGAILDEVQRAPTLLSYIQGIVDEQNRPGLVILSGSHQLSLQAEISQSLAGRTGILHLMPLSLAELKAASLEQSLDQQLFYGFYPRIYQHHIEPQRFYRDYLQTYVERDVKMMINIKDLDQFRRFLNLAATRIGQLVDYTSLANDLGLSRNTIKEWISLLKESFIITALPPYFENLGKRIIKSSKLYFNDVGLACHLLGIRTTEHLVNHPLRGYLFENLVVTEISKSLLNRGEETLLYFYRDSNRLEVDVVFQHGLDLIAIEIKSSSTFNKDFLNGLTRFQALVTPQPLKSYLIYSGDHQQKVHDHQVLNYNHAAEVVGE